MFLLSTLNIPFSRVSIVDFEKVNVSWEIVLPFIFYTKSFNKPHSPSKNMFKLNNKTWNGVNDVALMSLLPQMNIFSALI